jgi:hypothetical protein
MDSRRQPGSLVDNQIANLQPETTFYWKKVVEPIQHKIAIWSQSLR